LTAVESEQDVLDAIRRGSLVVTRDGRVFYYHEHRRRWYEKRVQRHPASERYRFYFKGGLTVYRNRIVWLFFHNEVPTSFVDHKDGDRFNDSPENLQLHSQVESHRQGYEAQRDKGFKDVLDWFDFIIENGCTPEEMGAETCELVA
jgi:hypothetical protein